jgi:hypothetical protein
MVSAKYLDDFYYCNDFYAKVGGIGKEDMNMLELELMRAFDFSFYIAEDEFYSYLTRLRNYQDVNE